MNIDNEVRPLIRIEIQNDMANSMEVDNPVDGETEDGEISDSGMNTVQDNTKVNLQCRGTTSTTHQNLGNKWLNKEGGFMTGVDIFAEDEVNKLNVRAKRFGISNSESKPILEHQIQDLYSSLRISASDEKMIRFEAIHMRGVEEMSTKDVFGYFSAYGPSSIEWINDYSCNVVWLDNVSAARALLALSKKINGFEFLDEENPFILKEVNNKSPSAETKTKTSTQGRSILLIQQEEESKQNSSAIDNNELWNSNEVIDLADISIPIPPGYWRYGKPHPKAKAILLRYAFKTDKKPFKAEKLSGYYKKYGNPNYGGLKGLISESRKKQMRGSVKVTREVREDITNKNPWGVLAKSWGNEDRGIEFNEPKEIISPRLEAVEEPKTTPPVTTAAISVRERLGLKRKASTDSGPDDANAKDSKRNKVPRMRMYADEEQERLNQLKKMKTLTQSRLKADTTNQMDLRNRLLLKSRKKPVVLPQLKIRLPPREDIDDYTENFENKPTNIFERRFRNASPPQPSREPNYSSGEEDNNLRYKRKSTVKVVVRNVPKPTVASAVTQNIRNSQNSQTTIRRLSDREQFKNYEKSERNSEDLREKISNRTHNKRKLRVHTTNSTLFRNVKKESSSESNESSDSDADSSDSSQSSSSSSSSSSSDSDAGSEVQEKEKHTSVLRKATSKLQHTELEKNIKGNLRIEVQNDNYKSTKSGLKIEVQNDNYMQS